MSSIRDVKIKDWEPLKELLQHVNREMPPVALELKPLIMKGPKWLAEFPKGDLGVFVVAEEKKTIIGFCYLAVPKFYRPVAYIGIVVQKEHRRNDVGSQLFFHVAEWAASKHLDYILADVLHWNIRSLKFFEKLDFVEQTRFKDTFGGTKEEKIRMAKKL